MHQSSDNKRKLLRLTVWVLCIILFSQNLYAKKITVFTIGDSTMARKNLSSTERGWGMLFPKFVDLDQVQVSNYGKNGRSTKSFISEGWWATIMDSLQAGDFVIIQFGHNDEKANAAVHTDPATTFRDNLKKFVNETREKGATPILLTPIVRRSFDANGNLADSHGDYPQAIRETAKLLNVPLIDIELKTRLLESIAGWNGTREIHKYEPPQVLDNTHLCNFGAYIIARMVAEDIKKQNIAIPLNTDAIPLAGAGDNTLDLAYRFFADNIQSAKKALTSMSSTLGYSGFLEAVATAQNNYNEHTCKSLKDINGATKRLHQAERNCRWTQFPPFDATFAIGNAGFEEGLGWDTSVNTNIPISWNLNIMSLNGKMTLENTNASDGFYCFSISVDTGSLIDFYQDVTLPAGKYNLCADVKPKAGSTVVIYAQIADRKNDSILSGSGNSWRTASVQFSVPAENTTVRLGITTSAAITIDNFKLMKKK